VRKQFPLQAAETIFIHKSQGSTLDEAAVSFKGRIQKHMVYVALSRVRTLKGLKLLDFDPMKITVDHLVQQEMLRMRNESSLQCTQSCFPKSSLTVACHNARSLHKHISQYRNDKRLNDVDVIVLQETWALKEDYKHHYHLNTFQDPYCIYTYIGRKRPHSGTFI